MRLLSDRWREEAAYLRKNMKGSGESSLTRLDACARWLESCADDYDRTEVPSWLDELLSALGWSSGTIHQAIEAVKRLTSSNIERNTEAINKIKDQLKRRIDVTNTLPDQQLAYVSILEWINENVA